MARKYWGDKEVKVLKELVAANISNDDINKVLPHRTLQGIRQKITQLGLSYTRTSDDEIDMAEFKRLMKEK